LPPGESGPPKKVRIIPLSVSAPFHCSLMKPAEQKMRQFLEKIEFKKPDFPIVQNYTAKVSSTAQEIRENLILQVSAPVLWMQSMKTMQSLPVNQFVECGSGKVLQGLAKKIDPEKLKVYTTNTQEEFLALNKELFN